jgi:hypothetical protein
MMASLEGLPRSDVESRARSGLVDGDGPDVVREAQIEINRLIASLAADGLTEFAGAESSREVAPAPRSTQSPEQLGETGRPTPEGDERKPGERAASIDERDRLARLTYVYLIISSRRALTKKYGKLGFEQLDADLHDLKQSIEACADLDAVIAYVDDEESMGRFGLQPVDPTNPWQVKKLVDTVDAQVVEQGGEVRYLLIVGGDGIIPFHRLPNPVDDQDSDVPSDNPYASRDANYLIPERAVGRMPDGRNEGVGFLHSLIRTAVESHRRAVASKGLFSILGTVLDSIRGFVPGPRANGRGLGYSASIWRKASRAVFHVIGDNKQLRTCPPLTYEAFQVIEPPHLSYFNLHGIEDGPNWYGQRDALFPADYPLFPLALRPQDPSIDEHANAVIFTEACYGANTLGKSQGDSIALRLLAVGALAVVGSTKVSYGSIAPPLLGADLMGKYFWEGLCAAHLTVGEALRHAKVTLASEMQRREGYLDDEDQKALISFVLYGDPALPITSIHKGTAMGVSTDVLCPPIICSGGVGVDGSPGQKGLAVTPASDELVARVKARIETSLPHMSHAKVRARPLTVCSAASYAVHEEGCALLDGEARCSIRTSIEPKSMNQQVPRGWALTLHKDITVGGDGAHHQVVKVVVDDDGRILKMAVSK